MDAIFRSEFVAEIKKHFSYICRCRQQYNILLLLGFLPTCGMQLMVAMVFPLYKLRAALARSNVLCSFEIQPQRTLVIFISKNGTVILILILRGIGNYWYQLIPKILVSVIHQALYTFTLNIYYKVRSIVAKIGVEGEGYSSFCFKSFR